jgi:glycosyltransferase involved in cell wall biosynthesis
MSNTGHVAGSRPRLSGNARRELRVLLATHSAQPGGAELAAVDLAVAVRAQHVNARLLVLDHDGPLTAIANKRGVPVLTVPLGAMALGVRRRSLRGAALATLPTAFCIYRVRRRLRAERIEILHTNCLKTHIIGRLATQALPTRHLMHVREVLTKDALGGAGFQLLKASARFADAAVAISEASARSFDLQLPVLPTAIDVGYFSQAQPIDDTCRRPLTVLSVGRLAPEKGQHVLIEAMANLPPHVVGRLDILGAPLLADQQWAAYLYRAAAADPRISFHGHVNDVGPWLSRSDCVVHAAVQPEGLGRAVVEAMAASRPVVATSAGAPEELLAGRLSRWLVPPGNSRALAQAVQDLHDNWLEALALLPIGFERAQQYQSDAVAATAVEVYELLVASHRPRALRRKALESLLAQTSSGTAQPRSPGSPNADDGQLVGACDQWHRGAQRGCATGRG